MKKTIVLTLTALVGLSGCSSKMAPSYLKSMIEPIIVNKQDNTVRIEYQLTPDSAHWPGGVNYISKDNTLFVTIKKCYARRKCDVAIKGNAATSTRTQQVLVPYHNEEKIVMIYNDQEEAFSIR